MKSRHEQQRVENLVGQAGFDQASARDVVAPRSGFARRLTNASRRSRRRKREAAYARRRRAKESADEL
jgi:hypothetical protein